MNASDSLLYPASYNNYASPAPYSRSNASASQQSQQDSDGFQTVFAQVAGDESSQTSNTEQADDSSSATQSNSNSTSGPRDNNSQNIDAKPSQAAAASNVPPSDGSKAKVSNGNSEPPQISFINGMLLITTPRPNGSAQSAASATSTQKGSGNQNAQAANQTTAPQQDQLVTADAATLLQSITQSVAQGAANSQPVKTTSNEPTDASTTKTSSEKSAVKSPAPKSQTAPPTSMPPGFDSLMPASWAQVMQQAQAEDTQSADTKTAAIAAAGSPAASAGDNGNTHTASATAQIAGASYQGADTLSFAMRIGLKEDEPGAKSAQAHSASQPTPEVASGDLQQSAGHPGTNAVPIVEPVSKTDAAHTGSLLESGLVPAQIDSSSARAGSESTTASTEQPQAPVPTDLEPQQAAPSSEPVRNVQVQLAGENNQRVNLNLSELGGELKLSVRTSDPALAQTLQDHMPELTSRLDQQHYRTEVWTPRVTANTESNSTNSGASSSDAGSSGQPQSDSGRRQNSQQQNQPDWLDDLEGFGPIATTSRRYQ